MPGDLILHNGLVWTCSLCHRTNFEKSEIEHRSVIRTSLVFASANGKRFNQMEDDGLGVVCDCCSEAILKKICQ